MKKFVVCFLLCFALILSGCKICQIPAQPGSIWASEDSSIRLVIISGNYATGELTLNGETTRIECHFGPGGECFAVYVLPEDSPNPQDLDAWLLDGDYHYNEKADTITFYVEGDQIGLDVDKIVLYEVEAPAENT